MAFDEQERSSRWMPAGANGGQDEPAPLAQGDELSERQQRGSEDLQHLAEEQRERRPDLPDGPDPSERETAAGTDIEPTHHLPGNAPQSEAETEERGSRVSVVN